jgi:hypothetical protein
VVVPTRTTTTQVFGQSSVVAPQNGGHLVSAAVYPFNIIIIIISSYIVWWNFTVAVVSLFGGRSQGGLVLES